MAAHRPHNRDSSPPRRRIDEATIEGDDILYENNMDAIHESARVTDMYGHSLKIAMSVIIKALKKMPIRFIIYGSGLDRLHDMVDEEEYYQDGKVLHHDVHSDIDIYCDCQDNIAAYIQGAMSKTMEKSWFCIKSAMHPTTIRLQWYQRTLLDITALTEDVFQEMWESADKIRGCHMGRKASDFVIFLETVKYLSRPGLSFSGDPAGSMGLSAKFENRKKEFDAARTSPPDLPFGESPLAPPSGGQREPISFVPGAGIFAGSIALICYEAMQGIGQAKIQHGEDGKRLYLVTDQPFTCCSFMSSTDVAEASVTYGHMFGDILPMATLFDNNILYYNVHKAPPEFVYVIFKVGDKEIKLISPILLLYEFMALCLSPSIRHRLYPGTTAVTTYHRILALFNYKWRHLCEVKSPTVYQSRCDVKPRPTHFFGSIEEVVFMQDEYILNLGDMVTLAEKKKSTTSDRYVQANYWSV